MYTNHPDRSRPRSTAAAGGTRVALTGALLLLGLHGPATGVLADGDAQIATPVTATASVGTSPTEMLWIHPGIRVEKRLLVPPPPPEPEAPPTPPDLLQRIRAGFMLPEVDKRAVQVHLDWYARHPAYLVRVMGRAQRYLHWIAEEVERRGMPAELALLPIVESAYDPFAYSHGRAAGLWQIIPGTGRRFGLKQNWWYDGRRDPIASTRAALDYLEKLHGDFDGDWLLAVAAYNSGEGNVLRAQKRNRRSGRDTDFWSLSLPRETEAYVPKLLALKALFADPERYGITLPVIPDEPYFAVVELEAQIDLALAADLAGVEIDQVYALNAGFNRWATDPDGPYRLLVPVATAERFRRELAALPEREQVRWVRYRIKSGDALQLIARAHQTTPEVIREVNALKGNTIRAGDYLMIPTATRSLDRYTSSAEARLARLQSSPKGETKSVHTVRSGESLWSISRKYGVSTRALAKWNGMAPGDTLSVGRKLVVWGARPQANVPAGGPRGTLRKINYTVRRGDSLARIAARFRVTVDDLKQWNREAARKKYLQPGQRLVMYVDVTRQSGA